MSVVVRSVYHKNGVDSTTTAYIIGICIKNWSRELVVYDDFDPMVNIVWNTRTAAANRNAVLP